MDRGHNSRSLRTRASTRRALKEEGISTPGLVFPIVSILSGFICLGAAVVYYFDGDSLTPIVCFITGVVLVLGGWILIRREWEMTQPLPFDEIEKEWREEKEPR